MVLQLELENPANWVPRDSQGFTATVDTPLPEYMSVVEFTSNVIGLLVDNAAAKETWNFAGWLERRINLPFGPSSTTSVIDYRKLWLRQKMLLRFPAIVPAYKIGIRFPRWFTQASVTVWEYQGSQGDTIENQLNQVEGKVDQLLLQYPP